MTIETQNTLITYVADDVAVSFPFTFPVYDATHLVVYFKEITSQILTPVATSDYTVTGIGDESGGSVDFLIPPTSDNRVMITRIVPYTQDLELLNQGGFYPSNVERELDLLTMQIQQVRELVGRAPVGQLGEEWPALPPTQQRAGKLLGFTNDVNAYPTTDTVTLLMGVLASILDAGTGISLTTGVDTITITNTLPGDQAAWLLESGTSGISGNAGDPEVIRDTIGLALQGLGCVISVNDAANTITVDVTQAVTTEVIRDAIGAALVAGSGISVTVDDAGDTITLGADSTGLGEIARDALGTALVGGTGITITVDDAGDLITIDNAPDILTVASAATVTPTFAYDQVNITGQAVNLTLANPTGTAVDGHGIMLRVKDNGTSRTITWGTQYRVFNDALPAATTAGKTLCIGIIYNAADTKWDVLGVRGEA